MMQQMEWINEIIYTNFSVAINCTNFIALKLALTHLFSVVFCPVLLQSTNLSLFFKNWHGTLTLPVCKILFLPWLAPWELCEELHDKCQACLKVRMLRCSSSWYPHLIQIWFKEIWMFYSFIAHSSEISVWSFSVRNYGGFLTKY